jgi:hypothetical protein
MSESLIVLPTTFDADAIKKHGWRQGAVLGPALLRAAREWASPGLTIADDDWLIVTSHDCDVVNDRLEKEPTVEVLRAEAVSRKAPDKQQVWGRNPRALQLQVTDESGTPVSLSLKVHDRWTLPRQLLSMERPKRFLPNKERRIIAEWLAKRYIRAAFPTAFDGRWRAKLREWTSLLEKHSRWVQGVYLRLSTLRELEERTPYKVHLIVAAPAAAKKEAGWATTRDELEREVETFWKQFTPGIECAGVYVVGTDQLTLAEIEPYQRFDADWVSFADDSPATPAAADMTA